MTFSPAIYKALLAGAARVPLIADAPPLTVLADDAHPLRLWHMVAATDLWQRAGCAPVQAQSAAALPSPAATTCSRDAERVLQLILQGIHVDQLARWLALANKHGMAVPHGALVPLLELSMQKSALRADLLPVLGPRGHWLVAQHPDWLAAYGADTAAPDTHWQLGTLNQRRAALLAMRRDDPAAALAALALEWASAPPEDRVAFLPILAHGLNPADEAFLEGVLDDKRKEVRVLAQHLLVALPGSRLVERCQARLLKLIGGVPPVVTVPDICDKAMQRDGIGNDTHRGLGEKAGWLLDLVRSVPPAFWSTTLALAPRDVMALFAHQEFSAALSTGLVHAAGRTLGAHPDVAAIDWFVLLATSDLAAATVLLGDMLRLPEAAQERIVFQWLGAGSYAAALQWADARFGATAEVMPLTLSQQMLAAVQQAVLAAPTSRYDTQRSLATLGRTLDPAVLATVSWPAPDWPHWPDWRDAVDKMMDTLQFRATMYAGFLENKG